MDYKKIYHTLITRGQLRSHIDGYSENHHIYPKCLGGTDESYNMVRLTAEEHYLAHQLLIKIYPNKPDLVFAATASTVTGNGQEGRTVLKEYAWLKKRRSVLLTGKKLSKESIEKRTKTRKARGWNRNPEQTRKKQKEARKNQVFSSGTIIKMKESAKNRPPISEETREKHRISKTGQNNPVFGKTSIRKGKTAIEIFGSKRADEISKKRSNSQKNLQKKSSISFICLETQEICHSFIYAFEKYNLVDINGFRLIVKNGGGPYGLYNWKLIKNNSRII